jgi:hypothetical protein
LRSGFGAGSVLVAGAGVLELSLFAAAGAGVLVSDAGAGDCIDEEFCAGWLGVLISLLWDCACGVVVASVELCA